MKKIDIEKWERKNPELPENFFDEMQEKVLAKTTKKREVKRFSLIAVWSSVAAMLIFGAIFFIDNKEVNDKNQVAVKVEQSEVISPKPIIDFEEKQEMKTEEIISEPVKKVQFATQKLEKKTMPKEPKNNDWEQAINTMTEEEIIDLAMNYEQDTFLELY